MRLCVFDNYRLGVLTEHDRVVEITAMLDHSVDPLDRMTALIAAWPNLHKRVAAAAASDPGVPTEQVILRAPQPRPRLILAAPVNYRRHQEEMGGPGGVYADATVKTIEVYGGFVKASSSIVGPDSAIELPFADRRVDHEAELAVVIGREARRVTEEDAATHIFGYVPLLDITLRGEEDRSFRKSFDTFTPIGPAIVTADEVPSPGRLAIELTVNGELRQRANTSELIYDVPRLVALYSSAMTLRPGDLIATGTPAGVGPIAPGDEVALAVEDIGCLTMRVVARGAASDLSH